MQAYTETENRGGNSKFVVNDFKKVIRNWEKVKLGNFSTESEIFFGNRGKCLRGDGRPCWRVCETSVIIAQCWPCSNEPPPLTAIKLLLGGSIDRSIGFRGCVKRTYEGVQALGLHHRCAINLYLQHIDGLHVHVGLSRGGHFVKSDFCVNAKWMASNGSQTVYPSPETCVLVVLYQTAVITKPWHLIEGSQAIVWNSIKLGNNISSFKGNFLILLTCFSKMHKGCSKTQIHVSQMTLFKDRSNSDIDILYNYV